MQPASNVGFQRQEIKESRLSTERFENEEKQFMIIVDYD